MTLLQSENYTDNVDSDFSRELYIHPNASTHGADGYVHVSYPRYFYNQSRMLSTTFDFTKLTINQNYSLTACKNWESQSLLIPTMERQLEAC
jgi:hypothetical protein